MFRVRYWTGTATAEKEFFYKESATAFCRTMQRRCEVVDGSGKVIATYRFGREVGKC